MRNRCGDCKNFIDSFMANKYNVGSHCLARKLVKTDDNKLEIATTDKMDAYRTEHGRQPRTIYLPVAYTDGPCGIFVINHVLSKIKNTYG